MTDSEALSRVLALAPDEALLAAAAVAYKQWQWAPVGMETAAEDAYALLRDEVNNRKLGGRLIDLLDTHLAARERWRIRARERMSQIDFI